MRIIITGVAGFLGSNLADRLLSEGHVVLGIDNLSHGDRTNLAEADNSTNFMFILADVANMDEMDSLPFEFNPDVVIHLASEKIPRYSDSFLTLDANQKMTENVCRLARENNARLIFASTSDIYGKNDIAPFREDSSFVLGNTDVKRWAYAVSKMHSEHYIIACHDRYGLDYTILRFFSCYGRRQSPGWWGGVQSAFMDKILMGEKVEIHGNGMQARCFTYIDDALEGIMLAIDTPRAVNQVFNIGNPSAYVTVYGLYKLLVGLTDKATPVDYIPYNALGKYEDAAVKIPDISKAREILGYSPKWSLYDGLKETIRWKLSKNNGQDSNGNSNV